MDIGQWWSSVTTQFQAAQARTSNPRSADSGEDIERLASRLLGQYDHDHSGAVELSNARELQRIDQRRDASSGHWAVMSGARLLRAADQRGDRDGRVTQAEIAALGRSYDTGHFFAWHHKGDGALDGAEMLRAMGEVGEEFVAFVGGASNGQGGGIFLAANQQGGVILGGDGRGAAAAAAGNAQSGRAGGTDGSGTWWNRAW